MNEILAFILKNTYSLKQLHHRLAILKSYLLKTFFGSTEQTVPPSKEDLIWLQNLPENFYQQFNKTNVYQLFKDIESEASRIVPLTIYLTFDPDDQTLAQMGTYARNFFGENTVLDTKIDSTLIAGCSLSFKGIQKDYSLRGKIEERKQEILDSFKKYLI